MSLYTSSKRVGFFGVQVVVYNVRVGPSGLEFPKPLNPKPWTLPPLSLGCRGSGF